MNLKKLKELEASGKYVFHGSASGNISQLDPRQAVSFGKSDGEPCVATSQYLSLAIFMAVIGSKKAGGWGMEGMKPSEPHFMYLDKSAWDKAQAENWHGFVYVCNKALFRQHNEWEWRSTNSVKPIEIIPVSLKDLPDDINILEDEILDKYRAEHSTEN
jgi:hypothetical protein